MPSTSEQTRPTTSLMFKILRDRICLLEYPPGMKLRESDLAAEFGVSRTPIRAALQRLAQAGLITSLDGVGTVVTDLRPEEVADIYQVRMKIAEMIGSLSPRAISADQKELVWKLKQRALRLKDHFDIEEYWKINHDLHFMIADIIGNHALRHMWDHFYFQAARIWYRHVRSNSTGAAVALHAELSEVSRAVDEEDVVAIGYIQRNHIAFGLKRLKM